MNIKLKFGNKIKEIEEKLHEYIKYYYSSYPFKTVQREKWILANKIYDMLVEDTSDEEEYTMYPVTATQIIHRVNVNCKNPIFTTEWKTNYIIGLWKHYDYLNN